MKNNNTVDLSIIIGNYNTKEILNNTITSIKKSIKKISYEIIIVDDASTDGSCSYISKKFKKINLICNSKNLGYSKSYNKGTRFAKGKYILHLNSDITFISFNLDLAIQYLSNNSKVGILGVKILKPDGYLDLPCRRSFPTLTNVIYQSLGLSLLFPKSKIFGSYYLTYLDDNKTIEVDCLMGAFMLIRKKVFQEIGYLDERFYIYGEDIDYCYRTKQAGWKIVYYPKIIVKHEHGGTTKQDVKKHIYMFHKAMAMYYLKHNNYHLLPIKILVIAAIVIRFFVAVSTSVIRNIFRSVAQF